ncbi:MULTISPECIES: SDR family NAD(P)-dependent oxidoreductase [unclassified Aerococcus]|uniref:SDR family NAD(P)-dependent oxidoreductase n=1 Tax=unclassified Aerococcus TaxID=2618060 RepID=UPI0025B8375C|nr:MULTISPECIES: SDR family oxidoreductase [unclassified Aerococcus]
MDLGLKGKVAVITGASRGIGFETAKTLAEEGAHVVITARHENRLIEAQTAIKEATGVEVDYAVADVTDLPVVQKAIADTAAKYGTIDILVNNAGGHRAGSFEEVDNDAWRFDLEIKIIGVANFTREVLPYMRKQASGSIISVVSNSGKTPGPKSVPTSPARSAGLAVIKELSKEYGEYNIRANAVCIGYIRSEQVEKMWQNDPENPTWEEFSKQKANDTHTPMGRVGETTEAAKVISFLASDAASYVSGAAVNIDGGASDAM